MHQVLSKVTPISELIDDVDVAELWAERKLERKHAWAELRCLCKMIDGVLVDDWISRSRVPDALAGIKPLSASGQHIVLVDDQLCVQAVDGKITPVIPLDFDFETVPIGRK